MEVTSGGTATPDGHHVLYVAGVRVTFPFKPYRSQILVMEKAIKALKAGGNALLESPTGTGKTLALLCASLAWRQQEVAAAADSAPAKPSAGPASGTSSASEAAAAMKKAAKCDPDDDDAPLLRPQIPEGESLVIASHATSRIYYCTRTHSQLSQITQELKSTVYRPVVSSLASREQLCINKDVLAAPNKDKACRVRKSLGMCQFYKKADALASSGPVLGKVWDIEDLVKAGQEERGCPYFASRALAKASGKAEIIFCPYNYLIDPRVRDKVGIELEGAVVIFDEAHNIEDVARDAASFDLDVAQLKVTEQDLAGMLTARSSAHVPKRLHRLVEGLNSFAENAIAALSAPKDAAGREKQPSGSGQQFEEQREVWSGDELLSLLNSCGMTREAMPKFFESIKELNGIVEARDISRFANGERNPVGDETVEDNTCISAKSLGQCESLVSLGSLLFSKGHFFKDYKMVLQRRPAKKKTLKNTLARHSFGNGKEPQKWIHTLSMWCMNPAVAFEPLSTQCRTVLLASGTLSPLTSFGNELETVFCEKVEAEHVIDMEKQAFISVFPKAPSGHELVGSYKSASALEYQDGIGEALLSFAGSVPDGVLVFFPSYSMLGRLMKRWRLTGLLGRLEAKKQVVEEPRDAQSFHMALEKYRAAIEMSAGTMNRSGPAGAILLAVCRGKVSEGIDFADWNARAVVVVGIPFPHLKDAKVQLKKEYNDHRVKALYQADADQKPFAKGTISGSQWYSLQGFRALNQALGRCLRHSSDYGAVILLDARYAAKRTQEQLSKWMRKDIRVQAEFSAGVRGIRSFFDNIKESGLERRPTISSTRVAKKKRPAPIMVSTNAFAGGGGGRGSGVGSPFGGGIPRQGMALSKKGAVPGKMKKKAPPTAISQAMLRHSSGMTAGAISMAQPGSMARSNSANSRFVSLDLSSARGQVRRGATPSAASYGKAASIRPRAIQAKREMVARPSGTSARSPIVCGDSPMGGSACGGGGCGKSRLPTGKAAVAAFEEDLAALSAGLELGGEVKIGCERCGSVLASTVASMVEERALAGVEDGYAGRLLRSVAAEEAKAAGQKAELLLVAKPCDSLVVGKCGPPARSVSGRSGEAMAFSNSVLPCHRGLAAQTKLSQSVWVAGDGIAYEPFLCFSCRDGGMAAANCIVGLKIVGASSEKAAALDQLWFLGPRVSNGEAAEADTNMEAFPLHKRQRSSSLEGEPPVKKVRP